MIVRPVLRSAPAEASLYQPPEQQVEPQGGEHHRDAGQRFNLI
jgi:hypothetical protein